MEHIYNDTFFSYIDAESCASATALIEGGLAWLKPESVLDVGCGRGAWLRHWRLAGVQRLAGIDGDFVDRAQLHFEPSDFHPRDLGQPFDLGEKFGLVESLEVAEHLPPAASDSFVDSLCAHGDMVLFSAAVPGQGGEHHVNERPLSYWRGLFAARGYRCFDTVRPLVLADRRIKPWYRYNTLLYVHQTAIGRLPEAVLRTEIDAHAPVPDLAPLPWRLRRLVVRMLPRAMVTAIAKAQARLKVTFGPGRSA